jgi:hypothetical protein
MDITTEQWARAEALKAVLSQRTEYLGMADTVEQVNRYAELILTGTLPAPAGEVRKTCLGCGQPWRLNPKSATLVRHNNPETGRPCEGAGLPPA